MAEFRTIGEPIKITLGSGKFFEVVEKASPSGDHFVTMSRGEYWADPDATDPDKRQGHRYIKGRNVSIKSSEVGNLIEALQKLQNGTNLHEDTPESESDSGD